MSVKTLISEEEYLRTSFEDRAPEYIDGELVERSVPNRSHSRTQTRLAGQFERLRERLPLFACTELRVPVAPTKYRIVDLAVYANQEPAEELPKELPLVVVEIVSPDDRHEDVMTRLAEFQAWGVPHVWLVDPGLQRLYVYHNGGLRAVEAFEVSEFGFRIAAGEILP
jgi:Uma2 family endonuclease